MADRVGQQLGNYRLVQKLGEGGFADVYLGEHIYLKTQAAIKILHTRLAKDDMEEFLNEARTVARLEHPHIVRVLQQYVSAALLAQTQSVSENAKGLIYVLEQNSASEVSLVSIDTSVQTAGNCT